MSLTDTLTTAILPVLSVAAVGYLLGARREIDVDPLNTVTIYVLVPALIFHSLTTTPLSGRTVAAVLGGVVAFNLGMAGVAELAGRALGETEPALSALVLASTFPNAANFGIPVSAFAFGDVGRSTAVVFIVGQATMMYTVGVYIASRGRRSPLRSLRRILGVPLVYAVVAAAVVRAAGLVPPTEGTAMRTIGLVGDAAIPVMLLMLGVQLANTDARTALWRVWPAASLKLLVAPLVGLGIALAVGFSDATVARVFVLETAGPAAVTPLVLAVEFDEPAGDTLSRAEYVSTAIFLTTVASAATVTVAIAVLRSGIVL